MNSVSRLEELASYAAEQATEILAQQPSDLTAEARFLEVLPQDGDPSSCWQVHWLIDLGDNLEFPVSMFVLEEHLEDEEALVLSMAAWILTALDDSPSARAS